MTVTDRGTRPELRARWMKRASVATFTCTALVVATATPALAADPVHGVVGSFCNSSRVAAEHSAGVTSVVFGARWDLMMPTAGAVDPNYVSQLGAAVRTCVAAGLTVVVDAGVQYVPSWARQLSGSTLLDQYGGSPTTNQLDLVFSAAVRTAVGTYLRNLVASLPPYTVSAIRVGTAPSGEIGLPGPSEGSQGHTDSWWAFGAAAQTGNGLAAGQTVSPLPGWIPGQSTWNGRAITASDAVTWWHWYEWSVIQAEYFLAVSVKNAGFRGSVHFPIAGRGVLPAELNTAASVLLAGANQVDDNFSRGLGYVDQLPLLGNALPGSVIDLTSVDDASAVTARRYSPAQDVCLANDASTSINPATAVSMWSNLRFARAQVARAGLAAVGENPGPPGPTTGGVSYSDPETVQVTRAVSYARSCGLAALYFAFEDDLFTGRSGITLATYASAW